LADNKENMPGTWSVAANFSKATSVLAGLKEVGDKVKILYAKGSNLDYDAAFEERAGMFGKDLKRDKRPCSRDHTGSGEYRQSIGCDCSSSW
jgi:beta-glucosidase